MELNEMEKKLLFQVEGDYQTKILNELYMTVRYSNNSEPVSYTHLPQGPLQRRRHLLAQRPQDRGGLEAVPPHCAAGIK